MAHDELDVDLQRLYKFRCKYGYCPPLVCGVRPVDEWEDGSVDSSATSAYRIQSRGYYNDADKQGCNLWKYPKYRDAEECLDACIDSVEEARAEGRTTNYGCVGNFPLDKEIPWQRYSGLDPDMVNVRGKCVCDHMLVNTLADTIVDALPIIAQVGYYLVMSTLKLVIDVGASVIPGVGRILDAGLGETAPFRSSFLFCPSFGRPVSPLPLPDWS